MPIILALERQRQENCQWDQGMPEKPSELLVVGYVVRPCLRQTSHQASKSFGLDIACSELICSPLVGKCGALLRWVIAAERLKYCGCRADQLSIGIPNADLLNRPAWWLGMLWVLGVVLLPCSFVIDQEGSCQERAGSTVGGYIKLKTHQPDIIYNMQIYFA